jgi:hypothetical protein
MGGVRLLALTLNMFNNFLGGLSSGNGSSGGGDALPTAARNGVTFDEIEATADFANQLGPPPAADITQTQGDAPAAGYILPPHPHPHPNKQAWGGGQQPTGEAAYSGIDSVLQKLGGKMYDPASIQAELAVQLRGTRATRQIGRLSASLWSMCKNSGCIWPC